MVKQEFDRGNQLDIGKRFAQKSCRTGLCSLLRSVSVMIRSHQDHWRPRRFLFHVARYFVAVTGGQIDVGQDQGGARRIK